MIEAPGGENMDNVKPGEIADEALAMAEKKARLPVSSMLLGGFMSGAYLGFAASVSYTAVAQGLSPVVGAILFPMGFVMLVLLGHELVTGNFALGYEHCVVNMFAVPAGMLFGAPITPADWWVWNQVPSTLGNIVVGALFTGFPLYYAHRLKRDARGA